MTDYTELIQSLRKCGTSLHYVNDCVCNHDGCCEAEPTCMYEMMRKAADAIEDLSQALDTAEGVLSEHLPQWIPVTERLPEKDGRYLVLSELGSFPPEPWYSVCYFAKDLYKVDKFDFADKKRKSGFYDSDSEYGYYEKSRITHWMPLPKLPEGELEK